MSFIKILYQKWFPGNTAAHRTFWKYRYFFKNTSMDEGEFKNSINHPHRTEIINEFRKFSSISRVLELGCSWGPNLYLLAQIYPNIDFVGVDVSGKMVETGARFFKSKSISNIKLKCSDMTSLEDFADHEFDLIITDASLIYVDSKRIMYCAKEMTRIARSGMILVEFDDDNGDPYGRVFQSNWIRDYGILFKKDASRINKRSFDETIWPGKWTEHGRIITVYFNN